MHLAGSKITEQLLNSTSYVTEEVCRSLKVCLVSRRRSFDVNLLAKEGGKEKTGEKVLRLFFFFLPPSHGPLRFVTLQFRFALAFVRDQTAKKNELPEEEEVCSLYHVKAKFICFLLFIEAYNIFSSTSR